MHELTSNAPTVDMGDIVLMPEEDCGVRVMRDRHRFMLGLSIFVVVMALLLQIGEGGHVAPRWLANVPLPVMCGSRAILGVECPGCGLTRSIVALAGGDITRSIAFHRVGWILGIIILLQIPYRLYRLWELKHGVLEHRWPVWFGRALIALLIGNWLLEQFAL